MLIYFLQSIDVWSEYIFYGNYISCEMMNHTWICDPTTGFNIMLFFFVCMFCFCIEIWNGSSLQQFTFSLFASWVLSYSKHLKIIKFDDTTVCKINFLYAPSRRFFFCWSIYNVVANLAAQHIFLVFVRFFDIYVWRHTNIIVIKCE